MNESQTIEYKESWRDEYIKWISGFANAQGGVLYIGKNDAGKIVGIDNALELLEIIPNKIRDILGIMVDVNLKEKDDLHYLEIIVDNYPYPVSYKGQYFLRSGSTKQELKGAALDTFLMRKQGCHWDSVPVPRISVKDLKSDSLDYFRKEALKSNRLSKSITDESNLHLLEKLQLIEGNYLKRAAVLLFSPDPEIFIPGAYIKIGRFKTNSELLFQNEIHGPLFEQIEKSIDLLLTKYLSAAISYKGIHRRETFPYPEEGLREALLNAISHKDYASNSPIQISVHDNQLYIWNEGRLPENWTILDLLKKHPSRPFNPHIANTFFRAGLVESWGRGVEKIIYECEKHGCPAPVFDYRESGLMLEFKAREINVTPEMSPETGSVPDVTPEMSPETESVLEMSPELRVAPESDAAANTSDRIVSLIKENPSITTIAIAEHVGIAKRTVLRHINKLKTLGIVERFGPTKRGVWRIIKIE